MSYRLGMAQSDDEQLVREVPPHTSSDESSEGDLI